MKLRPLIYALLGAVVVLLALRFTWLWEADRAAAQIDAQQIAAEHVAEQASRLLVATQDNLLFRNERSAQQWSALHKTLTDELERLAQFSGLESSQLEEMRLTLDDMKVLFARLKDLRHDSINADERAAVDMMSSRLVQALRQVSDRAFSYAIEVSELRVQHRERERNLVIVFNAVLLALTLLLSVLVFRRVLKPLKILADTAQRNQQVAMPNARVQYCANDEMGLAARSFNGMLDQLAAARSALEAGLAEQSRERQVLASIIEGTDAGTWEWNVQTGETRFNERWAQMIGRSLAELQPTNIDTWMAYAHPDDLAHSGRLLQAHFDGQTPYYECEARMRHSDGHWIWVLDRGRVFTRTPDGKPEWMYGTHQDITERKALELSLRKNEAFLARVGNVAGVGGAEFDLQNNTVQWNSIWRQILEVDESYQPTPDTALNFVSPEDLPRARNAMIALIKSGQPFDDIAQWVTARGRRIWARCTGEAVYSAADPPVLVSMVASLQDVTAQQEATKALALAKTQAEEASRAKSQFLANMSHEMRTPLNALLGIQQLLADSPLDERQRELLARSGSAGKALMGVINDVLDLARIEAGEMSLNDEVVIPASIAKAIADVYALQAQSKGLTLKVEAVGEVPGSVLGDADRIRQALANLVGNAIKFTATGSVMLRLERTEEQGSPWLRWTVQDTGPGIQADALARLFQPFVQADSSITRRFGGSGLGLSIVRQLAALMGGRAWAESQPGQGSRFYFEIPLRLPSQEAAQHADCESRPVGILLSLSDPPLQEAIQAHLTHLGWQFAALDPQQISPVASIAAQGGGPDGYVIDAALGELLLRALGAAAADPIKREGGMLPVVVVLGSDEEFAALERAGVPVDAEDRCPKPATATALMQALVSRLARQPGIENRLLKTGDRLPRSVRWLSGLRLLVVDDNEINRDVAEALLRDQGAIIHTCEDGQAALDWLSAHAAETDAVLMDVQMPVLDGLSACRAIKNNPALRHLPVLALSAGVLASEREAAFEAGMDGFLSKPMVPAEMVRQLRATTTHLTGHHVPVTVTEKSTGTQTATSAKSAAWPDIPGIDQAQAMRSAGDQPQQFNRLVALFVAQYSGWSEQWMQNVQKADPALRDAFKATLHKLRGSSSTLGASALTSEIHEVERLAAQPAADLRTLVNRVGQSLDSLISEITHWQSGQRGQGAERPGETQLHGANLPEEEQEWLERLRRLLVRQDIDAMDHVSRGFHGMERLFGADRAEALRSHVVSLNFDAALRLIGEVGSSATSCPGTTSAATH